MTTTLIADNASALHSRVLHDAAELARSATHVSTGPATASTVRQALARLRSYQPSNTGEVVAVVSPFLAAVMRASGSFADLEIVECQVKDGPNTDLSMLFVEGGIAVELSEVTQVPLPSTGWRRFLPWQSTRVAVTARSECRIVDQYRVEALITPSDELTNRLSILRSWQ